MDESPITISIPPPMNPEKLSTIKKKLKTKVKTKMRALPPIKLPKLPARPLRDRPSRAVAAARTLDFFESAKQLHESAWGLHPALVTEQAYVQLLENYLALHKAFEGYAADGTFTSYDSKERKEVPGTEKNTSERAEKLLGEARAGVERVAAFVNPQDNNC